MNFLQKRKVKKLFNTQFSLIPINIRSLLWIKDSIQTDIGEGAKNLQNIQQVGKITFAGASEPSIINTDLHVTSCNNPIPLGYFPSYNNLTPCQRYCYLEWLSDISKPTDIGNVFIYYYGLERYLLTNKYEDSILTINKLREYHKNNSFLSYSSNAIIFACLYHNRVDLFNSLSVELQFSPLFVFVKSLLTGALSPEDIISSCYYVDFKNRRYINAYPKLFTEAIKSVLQKNYSVNFFPIGKQEVKKSPISETSIFANISITYDKRQTRIYDPLQSPRISSKIYGLLQSAHDIVKNELKLLRKQSSKPIPKESKHYDKKRFDIRVYKSAELDLIRRIDESKSNIDLHFAYMNASEFYYKNREIEGNITKSELYAKYDISLFPELYNDILREMPSIPRLPSFNRLAIIFEKSDRIEEAIAICELAIKFTNESEQSKFKSKLQKLSKKRPKKQLANNDFLPM